MRSDDEVLARISQVTDDPMWAERSELITQLPFDKAARWLHPDSTEEAWGETRPDPALEIVRYLPFAIEKATNHRGITASLAIDHFRAWVWLLGDTQFDAVRWDQYDNYGMPILKQIATLAGFPWPATPAVNRMAAGRPCRKRCPDGCLP